MHQLIVTFTLAPDVPIDRFLEWSRTVDQPRTGAYPECREFEVYPVVIHNGQVAQTCDILERAVIDNYADWRERLASDEHADVAAQFDELVISETVQVFVTEM